MYPTTQPIVALTAIMEPQTMTVFAYARVCWFILAISPQPIWRADPVVLSSP